MRALAYERYGPVDVLTVREIPAPQPGAGQVLVRVRAAALNPKDVMVRKGRFRLISGGRFPKIVGLDFAGEVAGTGRAARAYREGTRVFGFVGGWSALRGSVADYLVASERELAAMPRSCSFEEAAAIPLAGSTALQAFARSRGRAIWRSRLHPRRRGRRRDLRDPDRESPRCDRRRHLWRYERAALSSARRERGGGLHGRRSLCAFRVPSRLRRVR